MSKFGGLSNVVNCNVTFSVSAKLYKLSRRDEGGQEMVFGRLGGRDAACPNLVPKWVKICNSGLKKARLWRTIPHWLKIYSSKEGSLI